jgi:hypothetical protein
MKNRYKQFYKLCFVVIGIFCLSATQVFAQSGTTQGKDFWVAFGNNFQKESSELIMQIQIVVSKPTDVTFTFMETGTTYTDFNVPAGVYTRTLIDTEKAGVYTKTTGNSTKKSLHIETTEAVSVYALNQLKYATDATNVLPANTLGMDYYHLSYMSAHSTYYDGYIVIATEDGTIIRKNGSEITLDKGGIYSNYESTDATGVHITSTKPVAYFVTNAGTQIPNGKATVDYLFQQMAPVNTWGKTFFVPVTTQGKERVRVLASEDGTDITKSSGGSPITTAGGENSLTSLDAGKFVEWEISGGCYITSNKPVAVCTYMLGNESIGSASDLIGDPSIAWVPSVEQFVTNTVIAPFETTVNTAINKHYAWIITPTATRKQTTLAIGSNSPSQLTGTWTTGSGIGSSYSFYSLPLTQPNSLYSLSNPKGLMVMGYGVGEYEAYYYTAASGAYDLANGFFVNDMYYVDVTGETFCDGVVELKTAYDYTGVTLSADYLKWEIDGVEDTDGANQWNWTTKTLPPGDHTVTLIVDGVDAVTTSFTIGTPIVSITGASTIRVDGTTTLSPNTGGTWKSSDNSVAMVTDDGIVTGKSVGSATFTFKSDYGCEATTNAVTVIKKQIFLPVNPGSFFYKK